MPGFQIYELDEALSAIRFLPENADSTMSLKNKEYEKQMQDNIQGRTLLLAFIRMSSKRKMDLLTSMFQHVRNLRILADILNIFFSVNTKLISYSKISTDSNALYEQYVHDHDRMLDPDTLEESVLDNTEWFTNLEDAGQMNIITSLMRLSGGSIIKKMYERLIKIFNKRNSEGKQEFKEYASSTSMLFSDNCEEELIKISDFQPRYVYQDDESDYNADCPSNKKVIEARKQWQANMAKLRKEIETEMQKLNEPILQRMREKQGSKLDTIKRKDSKNVKDNNQIKNSTYKTQETDMDWVQFLPVWNVKKIFSYLDEKTLHSLKNVNNYWATISKEVLAEIKTREYLNATLLKSEEFLNNLMDIPQPIGELDIQEGEIVEEPLVYRRRMNKQRRRGTLMKILQKEPGNMHSRSVLSECFKNFDTQSATFLTKLKPFPTDTPVNSPEYEVDKSVIVSLSEVVSVRALKTKLASEAKSPEGSGNENISSTASNLSLVPSIVVSVENMETW